MNTEERVREIPAVADQGVGVRVRVRVKGEGAGAAPSDLGNGGKKESCRLNVEGCRLGKGKIIDGRVEQRREHE